jgi:metallophosphoesterase (TIGR00282 family)
MKVLIIGDIISSVGRKALKTALPPIRERYGIDCCTANVENAAGIFGVTEKVIDEISSCGVDVMTSGNHIWDRHEGVELLDSRNDLLRPANYPPGLPGRGFTIRQAGSCRIAVINLQGRTFMTSIDCPFRRADEILSELPSDVKIILVDFHAEATSEKLAMGYYLDGRVSAVVGTHTHVQTADERIMEGGTAYITDVGMAGPFDSVIGVKKEQVIDRFLYGRTFRFEVAKSKPVIGALFVDIDEEGGRARYIERIHEKLEEEASGRKEE